MKIAYMFDAIYPYVTGGAEKRFWELSKRLSLKGHEVHIFGMKSWEGNSYLVKDGVHIHGISRHMSLYSKTGIRNTRQVLYFTFCILPSIWRERFDIIDCNAYPYLPFFPVKLFSLFKRIPLVITWQGVFGSYWYKYLGYIRGFIAYIIERMVIWLADNIIVNSLKIKNELIRCGVNEEDIVVIPNGVDLKLIEDTYENPEKSDLIFAGRLIKDKNVDILIKSVLLVKKEINDIKCLIIGEGPEKERLIRLAEELSLKNNIIFKDFLEHKEVVSYMKASKIFVFPSRRESFGIVVIEAMACGLPVITVSYPMNAATELVINNQNGLICNLDEKSIAQSISRLLKDEALRNKFATAASTARRNYDWDRITEENELFYSNVIRNYKKVFI